MPQIKNRLKSMRKLTIPYNYVAVIPIDPH